MPPDRLIPSFLLGIIVFSAPDHPSDRAGGKQKLETAVRMSVETTSGQELALTDDGLKPEALAVLRAIRERRSIGIVRPDAVPRPVIEQVLEAAVWAPNHHLTQPWRFFVLTGKAREELGDAMVQARLAQGAINPEIGSAAL